MKLPQVIWLGQSGFKITSSKGKVILIDPWKNFPPGNNLFPQEVELNDADVICVTHGHLDHLGDTVKLAKSRQAKKGLKVICIFEILIYLMEQGIDQEKLQGMNIGGAVEAFGIKFSMVRAVHSSGIGGFGPKSLLNGGTAAGFVIELENGFKLYHTGDTALFSDMKLIGKLYQPEMMMLPIGDVFTMDPRAAAQAVALVKPKLAIPMHFGGTFKLPGKPALFQKAVEKRLGNQVKVVIPQPGRRLSLD